DEPFGKVNVAPFQPFALSGAQSNKTADGEAWQKCGGCRFEQSGYFFGAKNFHVARPEFDALHAGHGIVNGVSTGHGELKEQMRPAAVVAIALATELLA